MGGSEISNMWIRWCSGGGKEFIDAVVCRLDASEDTIQAIEEEGKVGVDSHLWFPSDIMIDISCGGLEVAQLLVDGIYLQDK